MDQNGKSENRRHLRQTQHLMFFKRLREPAGGKVKVMSVKSDIEIAREAKMKPIVEVGKRIGIPDSALLNYGPYKAKVSFDFINSAQKNKDGKLILVSAITPTPAGEGKTTTTIGLGDGLNRIGKKAWLSARALARAVLRHEGRRGGRRLCAGGADGGHQPPLHRRLPRHHLGAQPALGDARQPPPLGQRARARRAPHRLAARDRHERPRARDDRRLGSAAPPTASRARTGFDITVGDAR